MQSKLIEKVMKLIESTIIHFKYKIFFSNLSQLLLDVQIYLEGYLDVP